MPKLREKPHAVAPLQLALVPVGSESDAAKGMATDANSSAVLGALVAKQQRNQFLFSDQYCPHPYAAEIAAAPVHDWQLEVPNEEELKAPQVSDKLMPRSIVITHTAYRQREYHS